MLRSHPRVTKTLLALAVLAAVPACGSNDEGTAGPEPAPPSATPVPPSSTPAPTSSAGGSSAPAVVPGSTLLGSVGTKANPDAFEIAVTDSSGAAVTTLPAGQYTIKVSDLSKIHNFVLQGEGVSAKTTVSGTGEQSFSVTFQPGEYTYRCDPHPDMNGAFTVS